MAEVLLPVRQANIASSLAPLAPSSASIVARVLRIPCSVPGTPAARRTSRKKLPKDSLVTRSHITFRKLLNLTFEGNADIDTALQNVRLRPKTWRVIC
jgi:hypothetical protein